MPPHRLLALTLVLGSTLSLSARAADDYTFFHENVMGTSLELRVRADSADAARRAEERALHEVDRLSRIFSGYDPSSEFSRWQAGPKHPQAISPELFEVLAACDHWRGVSRGSFDPRVEALSRLWSRCARENRLPDEAELAEARALMHEDAWQLIPLPSHDPRGDAVKQPAGLSPFAPRKERSPFGAPEDGNAAFGGAKGDEQTTDTVEPEVPARMAERPSDCPISLNGIAKGYIVERAGKAALNPADGVRGVMLNVGGDLRVCGDLVQRVGVVSPWADSEGADPLATIAVRDRSVSTSGRSQRGFAIGGRWYSHVFDPRTGRPVERTASATVIAPDGAMADALAKAFSVLPLEESLALAARLPDVACLISTGDGRVARSPGWERFESAPLVALADGKGAQAEPTGKKDGWGDEFELVVSFEINRPEAQGGRYRRPYVAVWVEDKDGFPVRNLLLWVSQGGAGPFQWLPDLKRWYRGDQVRKLVDKREMVFTIARPTRPPGKYTVVWDGKDDNGKPVAPGEYTVYIDAAREHGTYQTIRKPIRLSGQPFAEDLKGNVEIKSASVQYRRKGQAK